MTHDSHDSSLLVDRAGKSPSVGAGWRAGTDYKAYWQDRLRLTDEMFSHRKDMVLERLQEKWPLPRMSRLPQQRRKGEILDWLRPTLLKFKDIGRTYSSRHGFDPQGLSLLSLYTDFAVFVRQHYQSSTYYRKRSNEDREPKAEQGRYIKSDAEEEPYIKSEVDEPCPKRPRLSSAPIAKHDVRQRLLNEIGQTLRASTRNTPQSQHATASLANTNADIDLGRPSQIVKLEPQVKHRTEPKGISNTNTEPRLRTVAPEQRLAPIPTTRSHLQSATPQAQHNEQQFCWTEVEVRIDASLLEAGTIWMTMLDLMHDNLTLSHWNQFNLDRLLHQTSVEIGMDFDSTRYEFVYSSFDGMSFRFNNPGAYKIMLKRFSNVARTTNHILHLRIEAREAI